MRKRLLLPLFALIVTLSPLAALPDILSLAEAGQDQTKSALFDGKLYNDCEDDSCG